MRTQVAQALGQLGEVGAAHSSAIAQQITDPDPILRARAVEALGNFGASASHLAAEVGMLLFDHDSGVRTAAAAALPHVCKVKAVCTRVALWGISWHNLEAYNHLQGESSKERKAEAVRNNLTLNATERTHKEQLEDKLRHALAAGANKLVDDKKSRIGVKDIDVQLGASPFGDTDCVYIEVTAYAYDEDTLEKVYDALEMVETLQADVEAALRKLSFIDDITDYGEDDIEVECDEPEFATMPMHYDMVQEVMSRSEKMARIALRGGNTYVKLPDVTITKVDWFMPVKPASNTFDNNVEALTDMYDTETRYGQDVTGQKYYYNKETGTTSWNRRGAE